MIYYNYYYYYIIIAIIMANLLIIYMYVFNLLISIYCISKKTKQNKTYLTVLQMKTKSISKCYNHKKRLKRNPRNKVF